MQTTRVIRWMPLPLVAGAAVLMGASGPERPDGVRTIRAAYYSRLTDNRSGPTIAGSSPVIRTPRGHRYRVRVSGDGIDLASNVVPGNAAALRISRIQREHMVPGGGGRLIFDLEVTGAAQPGRRYPIDFHYLTGQRDRMWVEAQIGGRVTGMTPAEVTAGETAVITFTGTDLQGAVVAPSEGARFQGVVSSSPTQLRLRVHFPVDGDAARYITLGSEQSGPTEIFAFMGLRPIRVRGAASRPRGIERPKTICIVGPNQPCISP